MLAITGFFVQENGNVRSFFRLRNLIQFSIVNAKSNFILSGISANKRFSGIDQIAVHIGRGESIAVVHQNGDLIRKGKACCIKLRNRNISFQMPVFLYRFHRTGDIRRRKMRFFRQLFAKLRHFPVRQPMGAQIVFRSFFQVRFLGAHSAAKLL